MKSLKKIVLSNKHKIIFYAATKVQPDALIKF